MNGCGTAHRDARPTITNRLSQGERRPLLAASLPPKLSSSRGRGAGGGGGSQQALHQQRLGAVARKPALGAQLPQLRHAQPLHSSQ